MRADSYRHKFGQLEREPCCLSVALRQDPPVKHRKQELHKLTMLYLCFQRPQRNGYVGPWLPTSTSGLRRGQRHIKIKLNEMNMGCGIGTPVVSLLGSMVGSLTSLRLILVDFGTRGVTLGEWELILTVLEPSYSTYSLKLGTTPSVCKMGILSFAMSRVVTQINGGYVGKDW